MIPRHTQQAIRAAVWCGGAAVAGAICVGGAAGLKDPPWSLGILLAAGAVCSGAVFTIFYCQAILCLARAKGYSAAFFTSVFAGPFLGVVVKSIASDSPLVLVCMAMGPILPLILAIVMPDQGNAARDLEESRYASARCVQCDGRIPSSVKLCPHCGYTQPAADTAEAVNPASTSPAA